MRKKRHLTAEEIPLPLDEAFFVVEYCKDCDISRASLACGIELEEAYAIKEKPEVSVQIKNALRSQRIYGAITPEYLMHEFHDLALLAKQKGQLSVATNCYKVAGSLGLVDAYAPEKVELKGDKEVIERLMRNRKALGIEREKDGKVVTFK